jgi:hypothetical protein
MKILAILYKGGEAAKQEPRLLGTVENEVALSAFWDVRASSECYDDSSVCAHGWSKKVMNTLSVTTRRVPAAFFTRISLMSV